MRTTGTWLIVLATACTDGKGDDPPIDTDAAEDTWDSSAGIETDLEDTEPEVPDTGYTVSFSQEGRAMIVGAPSPEALVGVEGFTFRYVRENGTSGPTRCARMWDFKDWAHDEARFGQVNQITAEDLLKCDECVFTFTMSTTNYRSVDRVPWEVDTDPPPDTVDTDVDTDAPEEDGFKLDCEAIEDAGVFEQLAIYERDWVGYGYSPDYLSDDDDPNTGTIFVWDSFNRVWVDYILGATVVDNELRWTEVLQTVSYPIDY